MTKTPKPPKTPNTNDVWKGSTRRAFVQMLGLGAAALAVVKLGKAKPAADPPPAPTLWIGHC